MTNEITKLNGVSLVNNEIYLSIVDIKHKLCVY